MLNIEDLPFLQEAVIDDHARKAYDKRENIILPISPANSYFNLERVTILVKWAFTNFSKITILDFTE